jgi:hypothetical protein
LLGGYDYEGDSVRGFHGGSVLTPGM